LIRQFLPGAGEPRPDEAFRLLVQAWSKDAAAGPWQNDFRGPALEAYPLDAAVRVLPSGWRRFATPYDSEGLVYNLSSRSKASALLFCFRCEVAQSELATMPPRSPFSTTGGIAIGMWRRGDLVYVLAVQGGAPQYQNLLNKPTEIGFRLSLPEKLS
jgi:hypothetical protein